MELRWMADLLSERKMSRMGIPFEVITIRYSQIDHKASDNNGARLGYHLIPAVVRDYRQAMINGDTFPMMVVFKTPSGYVVADGNQRRGSIGELIADGLLEKDPELTVYLMKTDDNLLIEPFLRAANVTHGERGTLDERIANAVYCVQKLGMTVSNAAELFVIAAGTINNHIRAEETRKRLAKTGVDASSVRVSALDRMANIQDDNVLAKVGALVARHSPTEQVVKQAVERINAARTQPKRLAVVKEMERELATSNLITPGRNGKKQVAPKAPARPWKDKVERLSIQLADFLDYGRSGEGFTNFRELQFSGSNTDKIMEVFDRLQYRLSILIKSEKR